MLVRREHGCLPDRRLIPHFKGNKLNSLFELEFWARSCGHSLRCPKKDEISKIVDPFTLRSDKLSGS